VPSGYYQLDDTSKRRPRILRRPSKYGPALPPTRVECTVGADHTAAVVDTMLKNDGERSFVFVVPVEEAHPAASVRTDELLAEA
jgi:hypothetical protein